VISGRTFDRPGLKALLDYARAGDTLAVVRLDRLGRSLRELLEIVETLKARQIALVSLEEKIDTTSAAGELVFHVFGAIAQFERRLIAERTRDGVAARAQGRHPGRPKLDQEKLRAALTLIRNGMSPTKAARHVGLGRSTLYRELAPIPGALPRVAWRVLWNKGPRSPFQVRLMPRPMRLGPHPLPHLPPCQADQCDPQQYRWDRGAKAHSNRL
jgi:DNA invertase Pin-like site-specific DNA recombinase